MGKIVIQARLVQKEGYVVLSDPVLHEIGEEAAQRGVDAADGAGLKPIVALADEGVEVAKRHRGDVKALLPGPGKKEARLPKVDGARRLGALGFVLKIVPVLVQEQSVAALSGTTRHHGGSASLPGWSSRCLPSSFPAAAGGPASGSP